MIALAEMLLDPAKEAGMKIPEETDEQDGDEFHWDQEEFPHFTVFCSFQIGRPMPDFQAHWDNAKVIAALSEEEVKAIDITGLFAKGCR